MLGKLIDRFAEKKRERYVKSLVARGLVLGKNVQIVSSIFLDPSHCFLISIGDDTTICPNVRLIAHDASTKKALGFTKIGRIEIGANCFIGDSTIVLPNVRIGRGSIIGAGAVVTKDIPDGSVAAGNPARVVCTVEDYLRKMDTLAREKQVFGRDYFIEKLDDAKRREVLAALEKSIGFIV